MPAIWIIIAGVSMFMLFWIFTELTGTAVGLLSAGWFGVILLCLFEALQLYRTRTRKLSGDEEREEYYQRMRRLSARPRKR